MAHTADRAQQQSPAPAGQPAAPLPGLPPAGHPPPLPNYPRARIPTKPVLSRASFRRAAGHTPSILDAREARLVTSGRVAIALALRQMGVGAGDRVLMPSYHCASMIEPVVWLGATPVFYRIHGDTQVNLEDVAAKLAGAKVLLATNYFGFPQNLSALRAFCDQHRLMLLEDCAHCFLGEHNGQPVGSFGDYAIASTMKFFPIYEGGCLVSARHSLAPVRLEAGGFKFEAKMAVNALEDGFEYHRLRTLQRLLALPLGLKNFLLGQLKRHNHGAPPPGMAPRSSEGGFGFDPAWLHKRGSLFSRMMLRLVSRGRMGALRRQHYLRLQGALAGLPGCRPLHAALPERVYPWVFPLYVDLPGPVFDSLKNDGVPIVRFAEYLWQGVDATVCSTSVDLSRHVLQFPCHQELQEQELDWMIDKIKAALLAARAP